MLINNGVGVRAFVRWCDEKGILYLLPVAPRTLAAFVDDLAERLTPATIKTYVAAINRMHRDLDLPLPAGAGVVILAQKRTRRAAVEKGHRPKQATPMRRAHIDGTLERMGTSLMDLRDAAPYDTLCRAAELVALHVADVRSQGGDAVAYVARSKTDQEGDGDFRFVARYTFERVRAWVKAAGLDDDDPLFVPMSRNDRGKRLTRRDVARIYKRRVGEDFSAHSTRVSAAVEQRAAGVPTGLIAQAGGWKGDAIPARYTRHISAQESGAAILARRQGRA
ncbi:tyrosine-type recombinase/integrase [Rubellimicrobium roseum]|uniref:Tyr recombinase domain-containing protein n=1 Tax=Rubellimicrobium roseum TaxID=687525 RepID=A0A5C4N8Y7_9RHOB|nr:tyrosine-type recombinase/integrase [Rubellimicrobium roseum]TNC59235.1 hypothetical protein FHG71_23035 [Rubellimicrobium roseum]